MTATSDETAKALERLNGDYIYFRPQEIWEDYKKMTSFKKTFAKLFKGLYRALLFDEPSAHQLVESKAKQQGSYFFSLQLAHNDRLKKHIAGKMSEEDWKWLGVHGFFSDDSPYMKLYLHDIRLKKAYDATKRAQKENNSKYQKASNKVHNLNRKVGKKGMQ